MVFTRTAYPLKFARDILKINFIVIVIGIIAGAIYVARAYPALLGKMLMLTAFTIAAVCVVVLLFYKDRRGAAMGACFTGIVVWSMIVVAMFGSFRDIDRGSKEFAVEAARIVPANSNLVSYGHISSRFVQYYGKVVPEIQDKAKLLGLYEQGSWVVATYDNLGDLAEDKNFRKVYIRQKEEKEKEDEGGILFHKSAPIITSGAITDFESATSAKAD